MFLTCCNSWLSLRFIFLILALWYRFRAARSWQQQADHWKFWIGRWVSGKTHWRRWSTWGCAGGSRTSYTRLGAISYVRREIQNGISNNWIFPILAYSSWRCAAQHSNLQSQKTPTILWIAAWRCWETAYPWRVESGNLRESHQTSKENLILLTLKRWMTKWNQWSSR